MCDNTAHQNKKKKNEIAVEYLSEFDDGAMLRSRSLSNNRSYEQKYNHRTGGTGQVRQSRGQYLRIGMAVPIRSTGQLQSGEGLSIGGNAATDSRTRIPGPPHESPHVTSCRARLAAPRSAAVTIMPHVCMWLACPVHR